jgi:hypothetical protein
MCKLYLSKSLIDLNIKISEVVFSKAEIEAKGAVLFTISVFLRSVRNET